MKWQVIDSGIAPAIKNMAIDRELLTSLKTHQRPILHFYDWEGHSATYGYFIDPYAHLNSKFVEQRHLYLARRPTGGGIIFHLWDMAFSVLIPSTHHEYSNNTLKNYAWVNSRVIAAIQRFADVNSCLLEHQIAQNTDACSHFCMAMPTRYDIMVNGRKLGGGAQRRTRDGFLHQGTLSLFQPDFEYLQGLLDASVVEAMRANTHTLLEGQYAFSQLRSIKQELQAHLVNAFSLEIDKVDANGRSGLGGHSGQ